MRERPSPRWRTRAVVIGAVLAASCAAEPEPPPASGLGVTETDAALQACAPSESVDFELDTVATGLEVPWDIAFLTDGRALVTERGGRIREISPDRRLLDEPWATLEVHQSAESGLLGIDARVTQDGSEVVIVAGTVQHFGSNPVTRFVRGAARRLARSMDPERGHAMTLRVHRVEVGAGGEAGTWRVLLSDVPSAPVHTGGAVRFGPDGALYLTTGDGATPWAAWSAESLRGKVLRLSQEGGAHPGNPTEGSPVIASGSRNAQGMAWEPAAGTLFLVEHGPTGAANENLRRDNDELNAVAPGDALGWPVVSGLTQGGGLKSPLAEWTPAIAPAGLAILPNADPAGSTSAFVTALAGTSLRRVRLGQQPGNVPWRALCEEVLLDGTHGRLRMIRTAPDGSLWVGTSNRDQRGLPRRGDDMIVRLRPPPAPGP